MKVINDEKKMDWEEQKRYAYWLCNLPGIGDRGIKRLLESCGGTPKQVYHASEKQWEQVLSARQLEQMKQLTMEWKPEEAYQKMMGQGISFLLQEDKEYPERLRNIPDPPYGIFYKGRIPEEGRLSVAIIGARDCSQYGSYVATELGKYLGGKGVQIISGMARGIDGISQEAAIMAGGISFGVLGCGVDICYPAQNRRLYDRLLEEGGILSTHPPGTQPRPQHFPPRNRIVSGLADVVVVIEARQKSGTLITVDMALEQGKEVYVVPGRITDRLSDGCNNLLKQGAGVLVSPQCFYEEICALREEQKEVWSGQIQQKCNLPSDLQAVYEALDLYPQSLEQIAARLPDSCGHVQVNTSLLRLCMEDVAVQLSPGYFCRREGRE